MAKAAAQEPDWKTAVESHKFQGLLKAKEAFVVPAVIFFVLYYFALPLLVGYKPELMSRKVFGQLNFAYVFALSQFFMAWIVAALYLRAAGRFDAKAHEIVLEIARPKAGPKSKKARAK